MAIVQLHIGGQKYTVSCGDGQEESLKRSAALLDEKVTQVKQAGHVPETLGLVMGGILLANELEAARANLASVSAAVTPEALAQAAEILEKTAQRISVVAQTMESA